MPIEVEEYEKLDTQVFDLNTNFYKKVQFDEFKFRTDHMNMEENTTIQKIVREFSDIFHSDDRPLTFSYAVKHHIKTSDEDPTYNKSYRYLQVHKQEIKPQINEMLWQNIIRHSDSPCNTQIWAVPKN